MRGPCHISTPQRNSLTQYTSCLRARLDSGVLLSAALQQQVHDLQMAPRCGIVQRRKTFLRKRETERATCQRCTAHNKAR